GAEGVNMGTRFVATKECSAHDNVKKALVNATENDTQLIMRSLQNTERALRTPVTEKVVAIEATGTATFEDIRQYVMGSEGIKVTRDGEMDKGFFAAGEIVGLIHDIPTVQELFDQMISDAEAIVNQRLPNIVNN
ncbi:MAG: nitronate monooxygenase, partial [Coxiellaceae bacterium]|nr:nitronate monooxygenase [Coxiellaceae bacterium]